MLLLSGALIRTYMTLTPNHPQELPMSEVSLVESSLRNDAPLTTIDCAFVPALDCFSLSVSPSLPCQLSRRELGTHPSPHDILSLSHVIPAPGIISVPDIDSGRHLHRPFGLSSLALSYHSTDLTFSSAAHHAARTQALADIAPIQSKYVSAIAIEATQGRLLATAGDNGVCFSPAHTRSHHPIMPPALIHKPARSRSARQHTPLRCLPRSAVTHVPLPPVRVSALRWVDEQVCVAAAWDGSLRLLDVDAGAVASTTVLPGPLLEADVAPHSPLVAVAGHDLRLVDLRSPQAAHVYTGTGGRRAIGTLLNTPYLAAPVPWRAREWRSAVLHADTSKRPLHIPALAGPRGQRGGHLAANVGAAVVVGGRVRAQTSRATAGGGQSSSWHVSANVFSVAWTGEHGVVSGGIDGVVRVWDVRVGECVDAWTADEERERTVSECDNAAGRESENEEDEDDEADVEVLGMVGFGRPAAALTAHESAEEARLQLEARLREQLRRRRQEQDHPLAPRRERGEAVAQDGENEAEGVGVRLAAGTRTGMVSGRAAPPVMQVLPLSNGHTTTGRGAGVSGVRVCAWTGAGVITIWDRARHAVAATHTGGSAVEPPRGWLGVAATPRSGGLLARLPAPRTPMPLLRGTVVAGRVLLPYGSGVGVWGVGAVSAVSARAQREGVLVARAASVWEGMARGPGEDLVCLSGRAGPRALPHGGVVWGRASVRPNVGVAVACGGALGAVVRLGGGDAEDEPDDVEDEVQEVV